MTNNEWQRLLREVKNKGEYYMLTKSIKIYIKKYSHWASTCSEFINRYTTFEVTNWYKDFFYEEKE